MFKRSLIWVLLESLEVYLAVNFRALKLVAPKLNWTGQGYWAIIQEREREIVVCDLTCNWLSDNGGVVVRVVARVEKVVVKGSVKPIIEKFHRTHMKQSCEHHTVCSPHGKVRTTRQYHSPYVERYPIEQDLVIPVTKHPLINISYE